MPLCLEIAIQGLAALGYLHRKGYVHRDVSPDNLILTSDHEDNPLVKLIDLGIAKRLEGEMGRQLTATGMFMGKARYCSPEQCNGSDVTPSSDLYSFGVLLYELLTGKFPIEGRTISELLAGHLYHPPLSFAVTDPEHLLPDDLQRTLMRCLEKRPEARFATAEEFAGWLLPIQEQIESVELEATLQVTSKEVLAATAAALEKKREKEALPFDVDTHRLDVRQMAPGSRPDDGGAPARRP